MQTIPIDLYTSETRVRRRLKVESVGGAQGSTAFGEQSIAQDTPLLQITGQYGLLDDVLNIELGGSTYTENSNFVVSTGVGASNVAAIVSSRESQYKAGQGLKARFTALFTEGKPNSTQQAGFITSESVFGFGYNGDEFGIVHARDGRLENQELTITAGGGNETASVQVDGISYSIPITSSSAEANAFEIATYLDNNDPRYNFTSVNNIVYALAQLPDFGGGAFTFTSATAQASWNQIQSAVIPVETWITKEDWSEYSNIKIDPSLGNVYQVQIQYLGYGGIIFSVEDPDTAQLTPVHIIKYANTSLVPSVSNPIFRVGWAARNTGNNTDIQVKGASAASFLEGQLRYDGRPKGICQTQTNVGTARQSVLSLRNRLTFNNTANRAEIIPVAASFSTNTPQTAFFEIIQNPVYDDPIVFNRYSDGSLMEISKDQVNVIDGDVVDCFTVKESSSLQVEIGKIIESMIPGVTYCICASVSQGSSSDMDATFTFKEDL